MKIVSLGMNCETSSRLQFYFGKIESYPFSWAKINDPYKFLNVLKDFSNLYSGEVTLQEPGMLKFSNSEIGLHVVDRKGVLIKTLDKTSFDENRNFYLNQVSSKFSHLINKFCLLKNEDVVFVHLIDKKIDDVNDYVRQLSSLLKIYSTKMKLIILIPKNLYNDIEIEENLEVFMLKKLSNNPGFPAYDGDRKGWYKAFKSIGMKGKPFGYFIKTSKILRPFLKLIGKI